MGTTFKPFIYFKTINEILYHQSKTVRGSNIGEIPSIPLLLKAVLCRHFQSTNACLMVLWQEIIQLITQH